MVILIKVYIVVKDLYNFFIFILKWNINSENVKRFFFFMESWFKLNLLLWIMLEIVFFEIL